jgi:uncharacterized protein
MVSAAIKIPEQEIAVFCKKHHITKMALFGSVLRDDFGPESDVDVLVEFDPRNNPGLEYFDIQDRLSDLIGRRVDLVTYMGLSKYIRNKVLREAQTIYGGS